MSGFSDLGSATASTHWVASGFFSVYEACIMGGTAEMSPKKCTISGSPIKREYWVLQIMVFDDDADRVYYRRDRRISWSKKSHTIEVDGIRVLNPFITVLFKLNKPVLEDKEIHDIMQLIESKPTPLTGTANRKR
jgi:hypothetical protein